MCTPVQQRPIVPDTRLRSNSASDPALHFFLWCCRRKETKEIRVLTQEQHRMLQPWILRKPFPPERFTSNEQQLLFMGKDNNSWKKQECVCIYSNSWIFSLSCRNFEKVTRNRNPDSSIFRNKLCCKQRLTSIVIQENTQQTRKKNLPRN